MRNLPQPAYDPETAALERCRAHEQYVPLAEEIIRRVDEAAGSLSHMTDQSAPNMVESLDMILEDVEGEMRQRRFLEMFHSLPVETRTRMIGAYLEDGKMIEAVHAEGEYMLHRQSHIGMLEKLAEEGSERLALPMNRVPVGTNVEVSFYSRTDYDLAADATDLLNNFAHRRYIRGQKVDTGSRVRVAEDWSPAEFRADADYTHVTVQMGGPGGSNPTVYYGSPLSLGSGNVALFDGDGDRHDLLVGQVKLDRVEVLGSNIPLE